MHKIFAPLTLALLASTQAFAQEMKTSTVSQIESDCRCDLDVESAGSPEEAILFGLSTLWIDVFDLSKSTEKGTLFLSGEGETEHGTRDVLAAMIGQGDKRELRVVLAEVGGLDIKSAKAQILSVQSVTPVKSKPPKAKLVTASPKTTGPASVKTKTSNPFKGIKFAAPEIVKSGKYSQKIGNWTMVKAVQMATPGDPKSPRFTQRNYTPPKRSSDKALIDAALKSAGLTRAKYPKAEVLEVSMEMVGTHSVIAYGAARRKGEIVRFFANVDIHKNGTATSKVLEAPQSEWNSWAGMAVVMAMTGIYEPTDFTPQSLAEIRQLSPAQETKLTEEHFTAKMMSLFQGIIAANMGTLTAMQSFNMATATCAGESNCSVNLDGIGGYTAETK